MLAAAFSDLPSVDLSGQLYVGDQHVGGLPHAPCHRFFPGARVDHVVTFLSQRFNCEFADKGSSSTTSMRTVTSQRSEI
jgi:hypothetical protein